MDITSLISMPRLTVETIRSEALNKLLPGQILNARVLSATHGSQVRLNIQGNEVRAHTGIQMAAGERLLLSVVRAGNPMQMRVIRGTPESLVQSRAFRSALPRQAPLHQLLNRLTEHATTARQSGERVRESVLSSESTGTPSRLPVQTPLGPSGPVRMDTELSRITQRILNQVLRGSESLTPVRLRMMFEQSGLFLEARLATGQGLQSDLKAGLLQLQSQLLARLGAEAPDGGSKSVRQEPPSPTSPSMRFLSDMLSQTEGSLARLLLNQLASLPADEGGKQVWQFELPIQLSQQMNGFRLQISRDEQRQPGQQEGSWAVRIDFDLAGLGPVSSRLVLNGNRISSHFDTQDEGARRRIEQALPVLEQAFSRAGFEVGHLTARQDDRVMMESPLPRLPFPLLDEQA